MRKVVIAVLLSVSLGGCWFSSRGGDPFASVKEKDLYKVIQYQNAK